MGLFSKGARRVTARAKKAGNAAADAASDAAAKVPEPSPNPMTTVILADIALRAGGALLRRGVETGVLGQKFGTGKARKIVKGRSLTQSLVGTALARVATRSVPGAIVVGGGLLAKTLYDRRHAAAQKAKGEEQVAAQAEKGRKA
ncbi:hypothetical protein [Novosphingobium huizhouense]|uniref:hypothetical protein n=1 Tax=Novosphingobium huizhouense TaxID=2866625 RepID=UPI001CD8B257|nr:hypothetical protein [Novosphingobium huizhouense]